MEEHPWASRRKRFWLTNRHNPIMPRSTAHYKKNQEERRLIEDSNVSAQSLCATIDPVSPAPQDDVAPASISSDENTESDNENEENVTGAGEAPLHDVLSYSTDEELEGEREETGQSAADLQLQNDDCNASSESSDEESDTDPPQVTPRRDLDTPIYPGLTTTKFEVYLSSLFLMMRHGYTTVNLLDHFKFVNSIFGDDVIPASTTYVFDNLFKSSFKVEFHFYCPTCNYYFGKFENKGDCEKHCEVCNTVSSQNNFFMYIPMEQQLRDFLEKTPGVEDLLKHRMVRVSSEDTIRDVFDGEVYKSLVANNGFLSNFNNFSATVNSDGSPVWISCKNSMWPIQFRLNELPPNLRFEKQNTMVCGLWFGDKDPDMSVFLMPFVQEANRLFADGFTWQNSCGKKVRSKMVVLNCVLDSIAKPKIQGLKQFNGSFSCNYCYHPAFTLEGHTQSRFIMDDNVEVNERRQECRYTVTQHCRKTGALIAVHRVKDRKNEETRKDMDLISSGLCNDNLDNVSSTGSSSTSNNSEEEPSRENSSHRGDSAVSDRTRGVTSKSPFYFLFYFCLVFGFSLDYMHCVLIGVCKLVTQFHFDSKFSKEDFSIRKQFQDVDKRLRSIKPPSSISRRPRSLSELPRWKANEWRAYLLYYSVPCLAGILKPKYFKHHCLLVSGISLLLQDKITAEDLKTASWYLTLYVAEFSKLYGPLHMNFNVHLLLHLAKSVRLYGPLWSFSAFTFESGNGFLVKLVKGTRDVAGQIVKKYLMFRSVDRVASAYVVSDSTLDFCNAMMNYRLDKHATCKGKITLLGKPKFCNLTNEEIALNSSGVACIPRLTYERFIKAGIKYHSSKYYSRQGKKSNDSLAKLCDGSYAVIDRIFVSNADVMLVVRAVNTICTFSFNHQGASATVPHIKKCSGRLYGALRVIKGDSIFRKAVLVDVSGQGVDAYAIDMPNVFEKD